MLAKIDAPTPNHNFLMASVKPDLDKKLYIMPTTKHASRLSLKTIINSFMAYILVE